jgi:hypothetical protein
MLHKSCSAYPNIVFAKADVFSSFAYLLQSVSATVDESLALAVLVAVCLGKDMIYARAYCSQRCVGNERREFKHRRGRKPGPTGLSRLLSWRVTVYLQRVF